MTTGATGQLGLALPVQGELSGTWGDTVNNGITQYTNIAIAATLTLTNDGAVTLANTTGDASATNITSSLTGAGTVTAQFAIVKITGTLTTTKVITAPSYSKTYVVVNSATGGTVTFKASGQTGVSVAVGESAWVYYNGTDYVKIVGTATAGAAGGSNTQVQYNSSGSLAGSANLTFNGTTLTAAGLSGPHDGTVGATTPNTGSFTTLAASSTVSGTGFSTYLASPPAIGSTTANTGAFTTLTTSSTVTLNGGTANGVTYLNGSKVVTSGSALTFDGTNLGVPAEVYRTTDSSYLRLAGGNPAATGATVLMFGSTHATNPGRLSLGTSGSSATSFIDFTAGGNEQMRLTSTGLGIGTSSPATQLDVASSTGTEIVTRRIGGRTVNTYADGVNAILAYSTGALRIGETTSTVGSNFTERMRLDSSGNLGLGVTPSAWTTYTALQISTNSSIASYTNGETRYSSNAYYNSGAWKYITSSQLASAYTQGAGAHSWYTAASGTAGNAISFTQAMTLDASGNLAVGTTTNKVTQFGGSATGMTIGSATYPVLSLWDTADASYNMMVAQDGGSGYLWNNANGPLIFATNATERARISSTGGFSVGTTANPGAGAIYATGAITAYYSDARLKTVSGKIENALDKVAKLSGVYYTNNDTAKSFGYTSDEVQVGVLAQEIESVMPQVVKAAPFDLDADGNSKSGAHYKTVQYERLVPLLIEAINELQAKVKLLENK